MALTTAVLTTVTATTTTSVLLASSTTRKAVQIWNEGPNACYMAYAPTATLTAYTVIIPPQAILAVDEQCFQSTWSGITAAGTAVLRITDMTS